MLGQFGVNTVGLMDQDKYNKKYNDIENLYFTDEYDFEDEIVSTCFEKSKEDVLKDIIENNDTKGLRRKINKNKVNSIIAKYDIEMDDVGQDYDFRTDDTDLLYPLFLAWFDINKSSLMGRTIAESLPKRLNPSKFKEVLEAAVKVTENV